MATDAAKGDFNRGIDHRGGGMGIRVGGGFNAGAANAAIFNSMGRGGFARHRGGLHQMPGHGGCAFPLTGTIGNTPFNLNFEWGGGHEAMTGG
jgi:hypothetical protein